MHEVVEILEALPDCPLNVWFEPWAQGLRLCDRVAGAEALRSPG